MKKLILSVAAASSFLLFNACEKNDNVQTASNSDSGSMEVQMTDAPASYEALFIAITEAEVYSQSEGWVKLDGSGESFNILDFNNGQTKTVAVSNSVEAGVYTKLRLTFDPQVRIQVLASTGLLGSSMNGEFTVDWAGSNTIELEIDEEVMVGQNTVLMVDFDAANSIVEDGEKFIIQPVVREIQSNKTGIKGQANGAVNTMVLFDNGEFNGSVAADVDGSFEARGLKSGAYNVEIHYLIEVDGQLEYKKTSINSVIVQEGQITSMGAINLE